LENEGLSYDSITLTKSVQDSLLRAEFESQEMYNLYFSEPVSTQESSRTSIRNFNFFRPMSGIITSRFNLAEKHYGTDVVSAKNEAVVATLEGTVIYAGWTIETGHVIALQHVQNLISVYKHNSVLLKKEGDIAKAGEPIAISGQSGELATGPHLHFELWYNGTPLDPEDYIIFN
jgi:murein DD-endopeptidase MepM/ murein hydrolase activator NlpD